MRFLLALLLPLCALTGCLAGPRGSIKTPGATVVGVPDAGKPATLASETQGESLPIPEGSRLTVTKFEALPSIPATATEPARAAEPAKEVTELVLSKPTQWDRRSIRLTADTGTVDTTIRKHQIDAEESRPLLFAALASVIGAGVCMWLKYPTLALICGASAVVFFLAWKVSGLPPWFWVVGVAGLVGAAALYLGHERGEKSSQTPPATP